MWHCKLLLACLLYHTGVDELGHKIGGHFAHLHVLPHLCHLRLQGIELRQLSLCIGGLLLSGHLLSPNLLESSAPLARDLQHVGRDSFGH